MHISVSFKQHKSLLDVVIHNPEREGVWRANLLKARWAHMVEEDKKRKEYTNRVEDEENIPSKHKVQAH